MIDDLQRWLALEHEAVWLYGLIGGRHGELRDGAHDSWDDHRTARDRLIELIRHAGARPVGPALSYGGPTRTKATARGEAQDVEERIAAAAITVVGHPSHREYAVARLRAAARAAVRWGGKPQAFPGLDR